MIHGIRFAKLRLPFDPDPRADLAREQIQRIGKRG
jgi:hypothetical protein